MEVSLHPKSFNPDRQVYQYDILNSEHKVVGMAQLRLNPSRSPAMPDGFESHIYYEVDTEHRGRGIATAALKLLKIEARNHGIVELVLTADKDNIASNKVITKCGGDLVATGKTRDGVEVLKYTLKT